MNLMALQNEASGTGEELPPDPSAVDRLSEIQAPALILVGGADQPRTLAAADLLADGLPNARKVVMTGVAHLPNMERPEEFNRILLDYLEEAK
jgi:pimeloyl-ACP methyl ester carboxylesterase